MIWKEWNRRAFEEVEEEFDRVRDSWYQIFDCLVIGNYLYSIEDFNNLIKVLIYM